MLALASAWIGLVSLLLAGTMILYRAAFTDLTVTLVLYFASPGALCLAGLVLWAHRNEDSTDPALQAQRLQAKVGIGLALAAAAAVYVLVIRAARITPDWTGNAAGI